MDTSKATSEMTTQSREDGDFGGKHVFDGFEIDGDKFIEAITWEQWEAHFRTLDPLTLIKIAEQGPRTSVARIVLSHPGYFKKHIESLFGELFRLTNQMLSQGHYSVAVYESLRIGSGLDKQILDHIREILAYTQEHREIGFNLDGCDIPKWFKLTSM